MFHSDRLVIMRAADAIEKITINDPQYLTKHKNEIIDLCGTAKEKELKWHLALLIPRVHLDPIEFNMVRDILKKWAVSKTNSRIVRVNAIQGLFEMTKQDNNFKKDFILMLLEVEKENIPSINARIKKIRANC